MEDRHCTKESLTEWSQGFRSDGIYVCTGVSNRTQSVIKGFPRYIISTGSFNHGTDHLRVPYCFSSLFPTGLILIALLSDSGLCN